MFDESFLKTVDDYLSRIDGDFKEIYLKRSNGFVITKELDSETTADNCDAGAGLRIKRGGSWSFSHISTGDRDAMLSFLEQTAAGKQPEVIEKDKAGEEESAFAEPKERAGRSMASATEYLKNEGVSSFLSILRAGEEECVVVNSEGAMKSEKTSRMTFYAQTEVSNSNIGAKGADCMMEMKNPVEYSFDALCGKVVQESLRLAKVHLDARIAPEGEMPVVLESRAAGMLVHEAVGHILEADNHQVKGIGGLLGEMIASGSFSLVQNCKAGGLASFDDEGNMPSEQILIENGKVVSLLTDRRSADVLNMPMTGNARRENYNFEPLVRMWKIESPKGTASNEELLSDILIGLYIKRLSDGIVSLSRRHFVFPVAEGYLIRNGQIAEAVSNVEIAGATPDFLKRIVSVGSEREDGWGLCIKNNQTIWVGENIPSLKLAGVSVRASR
jgi:predicted Zn-dependent protease